MAGTRVSRIRILVGMTDDLTPGLHEALVTEALRARIERARQQGWIVDLDPIDDATLAEHLGSTHP